MQKGVIPIQILILVGLLIAAGGAYGVYVLTTKDSVDSQFKSRLLEDGSFEGFPDNPDGPLTNPLDVDAPEPVKDPRHEDSIGLISPPDLGFQDVDVGDQYPLDSIVPEVDPQASGGASSSGSPGSRLLVCGALSYKTVDLVCMEDTKKTNTLAYEYSLDILCSEGFVEAETVYDRCIEDCSALDAYASIACNSDCGDKYLFPLLDLFDQACADWIR